MEELFKLALGVVEPWYVKELRFDVESKRLDIELDFRKGSKFSRDEGSEVVWSVHDTIEKTWKHLRFFEHECYLHARVPRIKDDKGITMIMPPWNGKTAGFTLLFEALILQLAKQMPVLHVAKLGNISEYKVWRILDLYIDAARYYEDFSKVKSVGIDETSISKGHKYVSLFVDLAERKTIHVEEGKGSEVIKNFADILPSFNADKLQISDVSCDMSPAFIKGVKENLPNARITFDKFHIIKIINEAVDEIRRIEAKDNPILKNSRYVFLKNEINLTAQERKKKQELMNMENLNLKSMKALQIRENFQQIYQTKTREEFILWFKKWYLWVMQTGLQPMQKAANTIRKHWKGVVAWKESQINNGLLEGLNSVVQAAKRKARGYKPQHFITITYLITAKLNFNLINKHLPTRF